MTAYLQISFYIQETFVAPTQSKLTNCSGQFRDLQFGANGPRSLQPPTCFKAERHMCIRTCPNIAGLAGAMLHHLHNLCLPTSRIRNQIWDNYMQSPQFHPAQPKPNTSGVWRNHTPQSIPEHDDIRAEAWAKQANALESSWGAGRQCRSKRSQQHEKWKNDTRGGPLMPRDREVGPATRSQIPKPTEPALTSFGPQARLNAE